MDTATIKQRLQSHSIFLTEDQVGEHHAVIGYEKKFKWRWMATQMNTFVMAADLGQRTVTVEALESFLEASFAFAGENYKGWPRGLQSGMAVIAILISENVDQEAADYCTALKVGKKWAGFSVPVAIDSSSKELYKFKKNPAWGGIYYPHFKKLIEELTR